MSVSLDRLQALRRQSGAAKLAPVAVPSDPLLDQVAKLRGLLRVKRSQAPRVVQSTDRGIPGVELAPDLWFREQVLPLDVPWPLALDGTFARRDPIPCADLLFFDTETTGLAGGTGTRAFMVGAADIRSGALRVRQLTIANTVAEPAMLDAFRGWLSPSTILCSYNGRSYDAPLLKTRYRLMRQQEPMSGLAHVDLLYPTRRRYRGVYENCRLATIERRVLGIVREDDLPGSEAPGAWLGYLRGGSSHLLKRVLAHNHQDVVTLARLALHLEVPPCSP
jgi:uncharacterized protein YprB with RNaseH-like and TPR domain